MVAQMACDFFHRQVVQAGVIEDFARRRRARDARLDIHLAVFAVSRMQLELRPDAKEQSRQGEHEIHWIQTKNHKLGLID